MINFFLEKQQMSSDSKCHLQSLPGVAGQLLSQLQPTALGAAGRLFGDPKTAVTWWFCGNMTAGNQWPNRFQSVYIIVYIYICILQPICTYIHTYEDAELRVTENDSKQELMARGISLSPLKEVFGMMSPTWLVFFKYFTATDHF